MRLHKFKIDENQRETREDTFHHLRRFWTVYSDDEVEKFSGHIETIVKKPKPEFSLRFHAGNAGSETPFDGHLTVFGTGLYWGISAGGKLAQRLTSSPEYTYDGRDISLRLDDDGKVYIRVWAPSDRWVRGAYPRWRDGVFTVNPAEMIWGRKRYWYDDLDTADMVLSIPGDIEQYPVTVKLQQMSYGRVRSKRRIISYCVDVDAKLGIPDHFDHSAGWKGDRVYGFGVTVKNHGEGWEIDAKNLIIARILKDRGMSGFREAQPRD